MFTFAQPTCAKWTGPSASFIVGSVTWSRSWNIFASRVPHAHASLYRICRAPASPTVFRSSVWSSSASESVLISR